jgi:ABC-type transport system involved in multi-copper enzyme maturation permease subunit
MFKAFYTVVMRDLLLAMRNRSDILTTLFFFIIAISLFPLGIGPELDTLREIAPGVFWVAALLASMLALERLFAIDFADGTLEQLLLTPQPTTVLVLGKVLAHWLITGVPLVLLSPLLGLQYDLSSEAIQALMLTLLLGAAVVYSGPHFRCRCRGSHGFRTWRGRPCFHAGGNIIVVTGDGTTGNSCRPSGVRRIENLITKQKIYL